MKKRFVVKEFDKITSNVNYQNSTEFKYIDKEVFDEFKDFIDNFSATNEVNDAYDCFKRCHQRDVGEIIIAKNYVGLIQTKHGHQIEILPKIYSVGEDYDDYKAKLIVTKMLRSIFNIQSKALTISSLGVEKMSFHEIFIGLFLGEAEKLVKSGIKSDYISDSENLYCVKGKIKVEKNIFLNNTNKERFYCEYDEYQANRSENKLIKSCLLELNKISESNVNKKRIRDLLVFFDTVEKSNNYDYDFSKVCLDRSMNDYVLLIRWAKVILKNKGLTIFSGDVSSRSLLFPMEKLFESYVAKKTCKLFTEFGYEVTIQDRTFYLFDEPEKFEIRPDIVIRKQDGSLVILDTKWKVLINNANKNYGISQQDMYQMYAYAKKYNTKNIWLLYPLVEGMFNHEQISYSSNDDVIVKVFFIDLCNVEEGLEELRKII